MTQQANIATGSTTTYFPGSGADLWEAVDPASAGWDAAKLNEVLAYSREKNSSGLVILQHGRIVAEEYWQGANLHTTADVASCQKSAVSLLVGVAQSQGLLKIGDSVTSHLGTGWSNAPETVEAQITLRHLLTMTSGLDNALKSEAKPGETWFYNTPAYHLLRAVLEAKSGRSIGEFSAVNLFDRIGMSDSSWQDRPNMLAPLGARDTAAGKPARPLAGLVTSTRDMARFGLLVLENGRWNGTEVLKDKAYLAEALSPSQALNPAYGYLWWLNGKDRFVLPGRGRLGTGSMVPAAPSDLLCALGAGDKKIYASRSMGLVVARHGGPTGTTRDEAVSSFDSELWRRIMDAAPS